MSRVSCMSCVRTAAAVLFSMRKKKDQQRKPLLAKKRFKILQILQNFVVKKDASGNPLANCFDKICIQPSLYICILRSIQSSSKHM